VEKKGLTPLLFGQSPAAGDAAEMLMRNRGGKLGGKEGADS